MTTATATANAGGPDTAASGPAAAFSHILSTAVDVATSAVSHKAEELTAKLSKVASGTVDDVGEAAEEGLDDFAESGGAAQQAGGQGLRAGLQGKNPIIAAIRGLWSGGGPKVRAAIVTALVGMVLMLVLSPVLLLVFLLSWLIIAAAMKAKPEKKKD